MRCRVDVNDCGTLKTRCDVQEIYRDRKKFSKEVFEVASADLVNMGITVVSYTLKDIRDDQVINCNTLIL